MDALAFHYGGCLLAAVGLSQLEVLLGALNVIVPSPIRSLLPSTIKGVLLWGYALTYLDTTFKRGGYRSRWLQNLEIWKSVLAYFPARVICVNRLDANQQYLFASFPHGACTAQHVLTMTDGVKVLSEVHLGDRRDLAATILFYMPVVRELLLLLGNVDAGASTAKFNLEKGRSLLIFVGGEAEQLLTRRGAHRVYLKKRKGFIRLALKFGTPIVPCYCFGENDVFHTSDAFMGLRQWLCRNLRIGMSICWGRWGTLFPNKVPLSLVLGKPISVPKLQAQEITSEKVDAVHKEFVDSIGELFERYKVECGARKDARLEIM